MMVEDQFLGGAPCQGYIRALEIGATQFPGSRNTEGDHTRFNTQPCFFSMSLANASQAIGSQTAV